MTRCDIFTFRISQDERRLISALAERLQRTQSDAVRFVVVNAARELAAQEASRIEDIHPEVNDDQ